jgi:hypothetical protein
LARQAADTANKTIELAQNHQMKLKAIEVRLANMTKTQNALAQQVARRVTDPPGEVVSSAPTVDTSENSIFLAGLSTFRHKMDLQPETNLVFVVSYLLKQMGIYAGMESIVLADNAA